MSVLFALLRHASTGWNEDGRVAGAEDDADDGQRFVDGKLFRVGAGTNVNGGSGRGRGDGGSDGREMG